MRWIRRLTLGLALATALLVTAAPAFGHACPTGPDTFLSNGMPTDDNWSNGGQCALKPGMSSGAGYLALVGSFPNACKHLAAFNTSQWACDYQAAGISSLSADLHNAGTTDLEIRFVFCTNKGGGSCSASSNLFATSPVKVPAGSMQKGVVFKIDNSKLSNVGAVYIRHAPTNASAADVNGRLHVTNITPGK